MGYTEISAGESNILIIAKHVQKHVTYGQFLAELSYSSYDSLTFYFKLTECQQISRFIPSTGVTICRLVYKSLGFIPSFLKEESINVDWLLELSNNIE